MEDRTLLLALVELGVRDVALDLEDGIALVVVRGNETTRVRRSGGKLGAVGHFGGMWDSEEGR